MGAGVRQGKIHSGRLGCAEILVGTGILHRIESIPEHLVVGLLTIEQEINGLPYPLVMNLPV